MSVIRINADQVRAKIRKKVFNNIMSIKENKMLDYVMELLRKSEVKVKRSSNKTKSELLEDIACLEHNNKVLTETIDRQYINFKKLLEESDGK